MRLLLTLLLGITLLVCCSAEGKNIRRLVKRSAWNPRRRVVGQQSVIVRQPPVLTQPRPRPRPRPIPQRRPQPRPRPSIHHGHSIHTQVIQDHVQHHGWQPNWPRKRKYRPHFGLQSNGKPGRGVQGGGSIVIEHPGGGGSSDIEGVTIEGHDRGGDNEDHDYQGDVQGDDQGDAHDDQGDAPGDDEGNDDIREDDTADFGDGDEDKDEESDPTEDDVDDDDEKSYEKGDDNYGDGSDDSEESDSGDNGFRTGRFAGANRQLEPAVIPGKKPVRLEVEINPIQLAANA